MEDLGSEPMVTKYGFLDMQVCVPEGWSDEQVSEFAESNYPCGTAHGWQIRRQERYEIPDQLERQPCEGRGGFVHIMLDA